MAQWERAYLRMATAVAVLLLVAVGLLVARSGSERSSSAPSSPGAGSRQAPPPASSATGGSQGSVGTGGAAGTSGAMGAAATGGTGIEAAGPSNPLPNTGAPFPWWLGLLPLALGILLIAGLRRRPAAALSARSRTVNFDTSIDLPPRSRIRAGEKWLFADELDELDELERELPDIAAERPLVGGRAF